MSTNKDLLVAALDLGTTHSGYAFSMRHEFETDPLKIHANQAWDSGTWAFLSLKTPTCLLLDDKKQLKAIGYEAENYYAEMVMDGQQDEYFYFHRFKINFDNKKNISADMVLKDIHGRPVSAVVVYSLFIGALVDHLMNLIIKQKVIMKTPDIQWVLTIPIWTDAAKQFMRECAEKARIPAKRILLALEPEAASIFCQYLPKEKLYRADDFNLSAEGTRFLVADLGGSSANMTVFEKRQDGHLKELHRASGNHCGGTSVDDKFFQMLVKILGGLVMTKVKDEEPESYLEFSRAFEVVKRTLKTGQTRKVTMRIPFVALERQCEEMLGMNLKSVIASSPFADAISLGGHTLRIDANVMIELFRPTIRNILSLICDILNDKKIKTIGAVLLVGGFSECCLIQDAVMMRFRDTKITIPVDAGLSVLNGAVLFGHTMCNRG